MLADGLNKGCIERDALQRAMTEGIWLIEHEMKEHEEKELDVTLRTLANDALEWWDATCNKMLWTGNLSFEVTA